MLHCENSDCKHYYEDICMIDLNGKMVCIDNDGTCESTEPGVNECYEAEAKAGEPHEPIGRT